MGVSMLQINLLGSAVSGALVVLFGAGCALLFAFSQLKKARVCRTTTHLHWYIYKPRTT